MLTTAVATGVVVAALSLWSLPLVAASTLTTIYVSPAGVNSSKCGTEAKPCRTIRYALSIAVAGATVVVKEGTYAEYIKTSRNGKAGKPITLKAQGRVILTGSDSSGRIMDVLHDYHRISGFEFTSRDVHLRLLEADFTIVDHNYFHHAQQECVRVKYQSGNNLLERNRIESCGLRDFGGGGTGKNGEGIYIGTAPEQLNLNPTPSPDHSDNNVVRNNAFVTHGNECVDIKEAAEKNIVEFNDCTGQLDPESAGLDARGNSNTFRYNKTYGNVGAGIRFGGDLESDGTNNEAYGNEILNNGGYAVKVMRLPQGRICGNTAEGNVKGFSNEPTVENPPCGFPLLSPGVQPE